MLADLRTDLETIQWIITGPMLVNIPLIPLVSWLTTHLGTRQVYRGDGEGDGRTSGLANRLAVGIMDGNGCGACHRPTINVCKSV